jgi:hypothetical protein
VPSVQLSRGLGASFILAGYSRVLKPAPTDCHHVVRAGGRLQPVASKARGGVAGDELAAVVHSMTSSARASPTGCYEQATRDCKGGSYQIVESESHAGGLFADILPGPVTWYAMSSLTDASLTSRLEDHARR